MVCLCSEAILYQTALPQGDHNFHKGVKTRIRGKPKEYSTAAKLCSNHQENNTQLHNDLSCSQIRY